MRRRGLRRAKPVRQAISRIWSGFEGCRRYLDWVEKDLFLTFAGQLLKATSRLRLCQRVGCEPET